MSNNSNDSMGWIQLKDAPQGVEHGNILSINDNEFIIATSITMWSDKSLGGIYKYNYDNSEWKLLCNYPTSHNNNNLEINAVGLALNKESQKLYLYGYQPQMIIVDLNSYKFNIIKCFIDYCNFPCIVNIKGIIHLIGGKNNSKHLIWNDNDERFEEIYDFPEFSEINASSIIHISSKQIIMLFGGKKNEEEAINNIYIYSLQTNIWSTLQDIHFNLCYVGAILSSDEQYIIMVGGMDEHNNEKDEIYVLKIKNNDKYELRKSNIRCPRSGAHHVVKTGGGIKDEMVVSRYIKNVINTLKLNNMKIPSVIIDLITKWYSAEMLHWIEYNSGIKSKEHFVIPINDILNSIQEQ